MKTLQYIIFLSAIMYSVFTTLRFSKMEASLYKMQIRAEKELYLSSGLKKAIENISHCDSGEYCRDSILDGLNLIKRGKDER